MNRYILNSAVITTPGTYSYEKLTLFEAKKWLEKGEFYATIGYRETCDAFEQVFGIRIEPNRQQIYMDCGDEALVFRLTTRLNNPDLKGEKGIEFIMANIEIGLLKKQ